MSGLTPDSAARMTVPANVAGCGAGCMLVFVAFFVALAVYHLTNYSETQTVAVVASVLWLALVVVCLWGGIQATGGVIPAAVALLGEFSSRQFVEAARDGDRVVIGFGYKLFGRRFYYRRVKREQIVSVDMSSGQATDLAGRDMNDWHVVFWYREPDRDPPRVHVEGVRDDEVYIVGPPGPKEATGQFLGQFVAFLRAAGVELHPGPRENEYRTEVRSALPTELTENQR